MDMKNDMLIRDCELLLKKFENIGARARFRYEAFEDGRWRRDPGPYSIDIGYERYGEVFDFVLRKENLDIKTLEVRPKERHLLLLINDIDAVISNPGDPGNKEKFLCGHDERHWFVSGVSKKSTNVETAKESLKPKDVVLSQNKNRVKNKNRNKRRNRGFVRQGEWFFIPEPNVKVEEWLVMKNEPIRRGMGSAHIVEFLFRKGGETVYVANGYHKPLTPREYQDFTHDNPKMKNLNWRVMRRNPTAYAKGRIKHPDHKTIVLREWHRIALSEEIISQNVDFLD